MNKLCLFLISALISSCFGAEPQKSDKEGKIMPEFSLLLTDSTTWINSRKIPSGKPTVLFYLSPFCPYCKAQTKTITENMNKLKNIQFYFISYFSMSDVKNFQNEYQLAKYPNITTGLDSANFINNYFEIPAFPYLAIYGKDKKLNKIFVGSIYSDQIKKAAEE